MSRALSSHPRSSLQRTRSSLGSRQRVTRSSSTFERRDTAHRPLDLFELPGERKRTAPPSRPKTSVASTRQINPAIHFEQIQSKEVESLLRSIDRDERTLVDVDCLAHYRRLIEAINLRSTPFSAQLLCTLQQRENRIVQRNACRDVRFRSLIDALEPNPKITVKKHDFIEMYPLHTPLPPPTLIH